MSTEIPNHTSMTGPSLPVGKSIIHVDHEKMWVESLSLLANESASESFNVVQGWAPRSNGARATARSTPRLVSSTASGFSSSRRCRF